MIHSEMTITTEHQSIISSELIGLDYASSTHFFDHQIQKRLGTNVRQNLHLNHSLPLRDTEGRDFVGGTTFRIVNGRDEFLAYECFYLSPEIWT